MAFSNQEKTRIINSICAFIEDGSSLRKAIQGQGINTTTFYEWLEKDEEKAKQYARACEMRTEKLADEILEIADETSKDTIYTDAGEIPNNEWINRSKLRVDTRKWLLSKLAPKKYGDKLDLTTDGQKLGDNTITVEIVPPKKDDDE
jgi:hypothetical protein